jgi:rubrerythrin
MDAPANEPEWGAWTRLAHNLEVRHRYHFERDCVRTETEHRTLALLACGACGAIWQLPAGEKSPCPRCGAT